MLAVAAFLIWILTRPDVVEPGHLAGFERHFVIWLVLAFASLAVHSLMSQPGADDDSNASLRR